MDPPDDDIQFDFFEDEPVTAESASQPRRGIPQPRMPQRPSRRASSPAGAPPPAKPMATLGLVVFGVIFIVVFFVVVITSCTGESKHSTYANYVDKVSTIAAQSTSDGKLTVKAVTTTGATVAQIVTKFKSIAAAEQQNVNAAEALSVPGKLRSEHAHLIEALQLRVAGLDELAAAFQATVGSKDSTSANASTLSDKAYRLIASDVIWADLYTAPAQAQITADGVTDVTVPTSVFLAQPDAFASPRAMGFLLQRIAAGPTSTNPGQTTGLHGTDLVSVQAYPNGVNGASETLSLDHLNTVGTSPNLAFKVTIHDGGIGEEVGIPITLTIPQDKGGPITRTQTVQLIDPGADQTVTFHDVGNVSFSATKSTLRVDVAAVPGETNLKNNSAAFSVIFTLPN